MHSIIHDAVNHHLPGYIMLQSCATFTSASCTVDVSKGHNTLLQMQGERLMSQFPCGCANIDKLPVKLKGKLQRVPFKLNGKLAFTCTPAGL